MRREARAGLKATAGKRVTTYFLHVVFLSVSFKQRLVLFGRLYSKAFRLCGLKLGLTLKNTLNMRDILTLIVALS